MYFVVVLDYPDGGVSLMGDAYPQSRDELLVGGGAVRIPEDAPLLRVDYYAPAPLERVLAHVFEYPPDLLTQYLSETQPWTGFERVELASQPRW